mgnify:CR=1 FL=1
MSVPNLDLLCARYGCDMAKQVYEALKKGAENHITKSLGVLQENGVYAFFLYQASRGEREEAGAKKLARSADALLAEAAVDAGRFGVGDPLTATLDLAANLDQLLLAKRLLEQALIYARYHVKAQGGKT